MHFGFALELSNVDLLNIDLLDTHLDLLDTDIPSKYFACLHNVFKTFSRHLQDMSSRPTNVCWDIVQVLKGKIKTLIKSALSDFKKEIEKMSENEIEIEKPY